MWPTLKAINALGGSARNNEILSKVIELEGFSEEQQAAMVPNGSQSTIAYRLGWARTQLKHIHTITNAQVGVWAITDLGESMTEAKVMQLFQDFETAYNARRAEQAALKGTESVSGDIGIDEDSDWPASLLQILKAMDPSAFERLSQRLLRAVGFQSVIVTGKAGDQGIDGEGILQMNLITFSVGFQCKRYSSTVGPSTVRDFQGSIQGKHEKGLIITTATFSEAAQEAARRPGVIPIDLIDGVRLCELLAENELGVKIQMVPEYTVDASWYDSI